MAADAWPLCGRSRPSMPDRGGWRTPSPSIGRRSVSPSRRHQARGLRMTGRPRAALAAVEGALGQSDAVRLQSANPELRAQLQAPLRTAYDLELELLRERYERAIAAGRDKEADAIAAAAFVSADASRAQSLGDVAAQKYSPAVRRALASEFQRREALYRELAARQFALDARVDRSGS